MLKIKCINITAEHSLVRLTFQLPVFSILMIGDRSHLKKAKLFIKFHRCYLRIREEETDQAGEEEPSTSKPDASDTMEIECIVIEDTDQSDEDEEMEIVQESIQVIKRTIS